MEIKLLENPAKTRQGREWRWVFLGKPQSSLIGHRGCTGHLLCAKPVPGAGEPQRSPDGDVQPGQRNQ